MAAFTTTSGPDLLATQPFKVKRWSMVNSATEGTIAHGEGRKPDIAFLQANTASPTANAASVVNANTDATNISVDFANATGATDEYFLYAIWFDQGRATGDYGDSAIPLSSP